MNPLYTEVRMTPVGSRFPSFDRDLRKVIRPVVWFAVGDMSWNSGAMRLMIHFENLNQGDFHASTTNNKEW